MDAFKAWWNEASVRDQLALVVLGAAFVIFVLFYLVLDPISSMRADQEQRVASQRAAYARVEGLATRWKQHQSSSSKQGQNFGIEKVVESSFSKHGLRVSGFDASGRSGIRVRFEMISYEKLVTWVHDLEVVQGLRMKDVSVAGTPSPGMVSASILIQKN